VRDQLVGLEERPRIEQNVDALARRELAAVVLLLEAIFTAPQLGAALEIFEMLDRIHAIRAGLKVCATGGAPGTRSAVLQGCSAARRCGL
jgi:hypothetical protein